MQLASAELVLLAQELSNVCLVKGYNSARVSTAALLSGLGCDAKTLQGQW